MHRVNNSEYDIGEITECMHCGEPIECIDEVEEVDWRKELTGKEMGYSYTRGIWIHVGSENRLCNTGKTGAFPIVKN